MAGADRQVTLKDAVFELRRELRQREHLYPQWIESGRLERKEAERRLARLERALAALEQLADDEEKAGRLI